MKITIEPTKQVEIKVDGKSVGKFEIDSSWNGMTKFKNDQHMIIASEDKHTIGDSVTDHFAEIFADIFGDKKPEPKEMTVVKLSGGLAHLEKDAELNIKDSVLHGTYLRFHTELSFIVKLTHNGLVELSKLKYVQVAGSDEKYLIFGWEKQEGKNIYKLKIDSAKAVPEFPKHAALWFYE